MDTSKSSVKISNEVCSDQKAVKAQNILPTNSTANKNKALKVAEKSEATKQKEEVIRRNALIREEMSSDASICVETRIRGSTKHCRSPEYTCSHCTEETVLYSDAIRDSTNRINRRQQQFIKHVIDNHPEYKSAFTAELKQYWLDKDGCCTRTSIEEMEDAKKRDIREMKEVEYEIAPDLTSKGVIHYHMKSNNKRLNRVYSKCIREILEKMEEENDTSVHV